MRVRARHAPTSGSRWRSLSAPHAAADANRRGVDSCTAAENCFRIVALTYFKSELTYVIIEGHPSRTPPTLGAQHLNFGGSGIHGHATTRETNRQDRRGDLRSARRCQRGPTQEARAASITHRALDEGDGRPLRSPDC